MPVISLASSKGGTGKTTSTVLIANTLAEMGLSVFIIDAEPRSNANVATWYQAGDVNPLIQMKRCSERAEIRRVFAEAVDSADFVVIDMPGAESPLNSYLMAKSNLVLIPVAIGQGDKDSGEDTRDQFELAAETSSNPGQLRMFFSQVENKDPQFFSRLTKAFMGAVRAEHGDILTTAHIKNLDAYKALMVIGGSLHGNDALTGLVTDKQLLVAQENAQAFTDEILTILAKQMKAAQ